MPQKYILALDIGGSKINSGLVGPTGKIIFGLKTKTEAQKSKTIILQNTFKVINALLLIAKLKKFNIKAIAIGIAGQADPGKGVFLGGPNFSPSFKNINLKNILRKKYHLPVFIDNDTHCFVLGEATYGLGKNYKNIIGLTLGTGIGGGIIIDKKLYRGNNNTAGELGHITLKAGKDKCSCGQIGHFEAGASAQALVRYYKQLTGKNPGAKKIELRLKQGEKAAKEATKIVAKNLGEGLANITAMFNPNLIVLGGGLARFKEYVNQGIREMKKQLPLQSLLKTKVVKSKLGDDAQLLGAMLLYETAKHYEKYEKKK